MTPEEYALLGYDTLPLLPGTKRTDYKGWQKADPARLWESAPKDANIGIRAGGASRVAILDCDEYKRAGTIANVTAILAGLGCLPDDYPVVTTAQGGKHIYITLAGAPLPRNYHNFPPAIGAGEFRHGCGSYVAAPSSVVNGRAYELAQGDWRQLPRLDTADVKSFIGEELPEVNNYDLDTQGKIPRRAWALLHGETCENYPSRSEAEQALILALVNAGHNFESVLGLFMRFPCGGKFAELRAKSEGRAIGWLRRSYNNALRRAQIDSPGRKTARDVQLWAQAKGWSGKTGAYDRAVFLAHTTIAYQAGRVNWAASLRDLAERAGVSIGAAKNANARLIDSKILTRAQEHTASLANRFTWGELPPLGTNLYTPQVLSTVRECISLSASHDAFRWLGLGKTGSQVWDALEAGALTEIELVQKTGRHVKTIRRMLDRMSSPELIDPRTGEVLALVEKVGDKWEHLPVDLENIARVLGVAGTGAAQKARHKQEREAHNRALKGER